MNAIITVGLGFGDEGKGATVDSLCRTYKSPLVVRYSGGCQAGHNVVLPDGRHHTFSQFGAGTFAGAKTYLGPEVIIDPAAMVIEADHLTEIGVSKYPWDKLVVDPDCLVTTPIHRACNLFLNSVNNNGSCGMGIGVAREYWLKYGKDAITAADLREGVKPLADKLRLLKARLVNKTSLENVEYNEVAKTHFTFLVDVSPTKIASHLYEISENLMFGDKVTSNMESSDTIIFEGAQGVLLDQHVGFHPHTTWSDVTPNPAFEICNRWGIENIHVMGITRAYSTRHGNGPFPANPAPKATESNYIPGADSHNKPNYQGVFRSGPLDIQLLRYAINSVRPNSIAVTCLDQLPENQEVIKRYVWGAEGDLFDKPSWTLAVSITRSNSLFGHRAVVEKVPYVLDEIKKLKVPISGTSDGPTYKDREWYPEKLTFQPL